MSCIRSSADLFTGFVCLPFARTFQPHERETAVFKPRKTWLVPIAATIAVIGLVSTTAYAVGTFRSGSQTSRHYIIDETDPFTVGAAGVWLDVPTAAVTVNVPAGTSRLISARYNAESLCGGPGWCSVRIVYVTPAGATVELAPQSGTDFAFDSAGGSWQAHAIERTARSYVGPGNYSVRVQAQRVAGATSFRLDDYSTHIELINP
jgi:hypothetical protein